MYDSNIYRQAGDAVVRSWAGLLCVADPGAMSGQLAACSCIGVHAVVQFLFLSWSVRVPALVTRFCHSFAADCRGRAV